MEFRDQALLAKVKGDPQLECALRIALAADKSAIAHERMAVALERLADTIETVIENEQQRIEEDDAAFAKSQMLAEERRGRLIALVAKIAPELAALFPGTEVQVDDGDAAAAPSRGPSAVQ